MSPLPRLNSLLHWPLAPRTVAAQVARRGGDSHADASCATPSTTAAWPTPRGGRALPRFAGGATRMHGLRTPHESGDSLDGDSLPALRRALAPPVGRGEPLLAAPEASLQPPVERLDDDAVAALPAFTAALLRHWGDREAPCLLAGYGDGAALLIDFARGEVMADASAWERLVARRELPQLASETFAVEGPTHRAKLYRIECLVWAAGVASAALPLLGAPAAWSRACIAARGALQWRRFTRAPAQLHLADEVACGATTPAQLRRATRVDVRELRAFLQAGLFLRLLQWNR